MLEDPTETKDLGLPPGRRPVKKNESRTYRLLDSGGFQKLEDVGGVRLVRPSAQAIWTPRLPREEWKMADAVFTRSSDNDGKWNVHKKIPESWQIEIEGISLVMKRTGFGHLGIFPEQAENWGWLQEQCRRLPRGIHALNLFAYTGGSTLALAHAGAKVTHVDAARGVVSWARENARNQGVADTVVQWLIEDVMRYCHREQKRGHRYQAIILDPPTFGRGPKNE